MEKIKRFLRWIKRGIVHVLPIFLFFLIAFTLINWVEAYLFKHMGVSPFRFLDIAVAAALIAKIVLVADQFRLIALFDREPLFYSILWKTAFYWLLLLVIRFGIRFAHLSGQSLGEDLGRFIYGPNWNVFISIQFIYLLLLFIFVTLQELTRKIGARRMKKLFFGK